MKKKFFFFLISLGVAACNFQQEPPVEFSQQQIGQVVAKMTDVMVHDVTNPPLAARFFSYACLAGYEVIALNDSNYQSMYGRLNEFPEISELVGIEGHHYQLSALLAMMETAKNLQPSGAIIEEYEQQFLDSCRRSGFSEQVIKPSLQYAQAVSKEILSYAKADKYNRISNYPRFSPSEEEGAWYPTPPGFFAPIESHFNTIRPLTLDSSNQFVPAPPVAFSTDQNSEFYQLLQEVYLEGGSSLTQEKKDIASFWDCNPFALQDEGHLMVGLKKISPGAHWMGIAGIACKDAGLDFEQSMKVSTMVAIGLLDSFISCWDEKFRSNRIRPETAIRKHLDPQWEPLLQTPPFPEYVSGHSTVSSASAVILTHYFGENFTFTDTVERRFYLPDRKFDSFHQAAQEASISRLYGGIHFMDAILNGQTQGLKVGEWVMKSLESGKPINGAVAESKKIATPQ